MKKYITTLLLVLITLLCFCSTEARWVGITDGARRVQLESNGSVPITIQDQTTPSLIIPMSQAVDSTTLTVATALDDYTLTIADTTNFIDGSFVIVLNEEKSRYWFGYQVGAPAGNVISVDRPFDCLYQIGDGVTSAITNMNVNGATTTQVFRVRVGEPPGGIDVTIDVTRIIIYMVTDSAVNLASFGDITGGITHGITFRRVNGVYQNIFNVKTNGELASLAYDLDLYEATNPRYGQDGLACRLTFGGQNKMGVVLRIGPNEDLQMLINDDLTDITELRVVVEGSLAIID